MAAVTKVKPRSVQIPGYELNDVCELVAAVDAGDLLVYNGVEVNGMPQMVRATAGAGEADGIALRDGYAGERGFDVGIIGEMDGFAGLTPGAGLYPSASVAGGIDTTRPTGAAAQIKAVRSTRIRFNFTVEGVSA